MKLWILFLFLIPLFSNATGIADFNPVSHWTCDETSGVRYDSNTVTGNDLTDNNTVGYATGLLSNACDFEYSNSEYLSITNANQTNLNITSDFSISMWVKIESETGPGWQSFISNLSQSGGLSGYSLRWHNDDLFYTMIYDDSSGVAKTYSTAYSTEWHHLIWTFTCSSKIYELYIDGTSQGELTGSICPTDGNNDFILGANGEGPGLYSDALIDEVSFFNTVLSESDVTTLYNSGTPLGYAGAGGSSTPTSTATTTTSTLNSDDIVFMLGIIIFFLTFLWFGFIVNTFKKV